MFEKKLIFEVFRLGKKVKIHIIACDTNSAVGKIRNLSKREALILYDIATRW